MNVNLCDTTAIVTGSSGGIGAALVRELRDCGATVIGIDIVEPGDSSPDVFINGDVRDEMIVQRAIKHARTTTWCLVPCAAIGPFDKARPSDVLDVNYVAAIANLRTTVAAFGSPGSAVLIGSIAASRQDFASKWSLAKNLELVSSDESVSPEMAYGLSKWALASAAERLAAALVPQHVRVNHVVLGPTETPATSRLRAEQPERWTQLIAEIPLGGVNRVEDVAAAIVFLLSPVASRITGSTICIDGGWTACRQLPTE